MALPSAPAIRYPGRDPIRGRIEGGVAVAELKTKANDASVEAFLAGIEPEERREDCRTLAALMHDATGEEPRMWGSTIVGFGSYAYRYASGRTGTLFQIGFAPRKRDLTLYLMGGVGRHSELLERLGPHRHGKGCLYLKRLDGLDRPTLEALIGAAVARARTLDAEVAMDAG